jgi:hypothetical protein
MIRADVEDGNLRPNLVPVPEAFGPAEEAQVKRLICVTGFGAGDSRGRRGFLYSAAFHLLLGCVYDDKDVQEPWLKTTLVQCAWSAVRKKGSYLQAQFLRLKARRGPKKAIMAVAASILTAIYHMLKDGTLYQDLGSNHFQNRSKGQQTNRLIKRLADLGYDVALTPRTS